MLDNVLRFSLLNVDRREVQTLRPTTSLDTYLGASKEFHPDGLYSTITFGPIGSERRSNTFSYIDCGVELISPMIALALFDLKQLYAEIMAGKRYAIWDPELKDFFAADASDVGADTGYAFFVKRIKELTPAPNESKQRQENIDLFYKYRDWCLSRYVLVWPAGKRDIEVTAGREQEPDVNGLYRSLLAAANVVPTTASSGVANPIVLDPTRWSMQNTFNEIFMYFFDWMDGKKGGIRGKVTHRRIYNGTRNVLSSMDTSSVVMDRADEIRPTDTIVGLYQGVKSILPVAIHAMRTKYIPDAVGPDGVLYLVNKKTLVREQIKATSADYDLFASDEGLEALIEQLLSPEKRHEPVGTKTHWLALIYQDDTQFRVFGDISELPDGWDRSKVSPITLAEFIYLSGYDRWNDYFLTISRYPITGTGSTYSSTIRLTTTRTTKMLYELDSDWTTKFDKPAIDFPIRTEVEFVTSMAPHLININPMSADFDGDLGSADSSYTDESLKEHRDLMNKATFWVSTSGKLTVDINVDLVQRTMVSLLGD